MRILKIWCFMFLALAAAAARAEVNPVYTSWAQHGVGTSVTIRQEGGGMKGAVEMISTLVEKAPDKVVIEIVLRGAPKTLTRMQIKAEAQPQRGRGKGPKGDVKESEETVVVAGREYKTKVIEETRKGSGQTVWEKTWTSPQFPGMTIKSMQKVDGAQKVETTKEAVEVTIK